MNFNEQFSEMIEFIENGPGIFALTLMIGGPMISFVMIILDARKENKLSDDTTSASKHEESELSDFATTISEHLNDIVVTADNTIYRKYELIDVNNTIKHQKLMWKYPEFYNYVYRFNPKGLRWHIQSVSFTESKDCKYRVRLVGLNDENELSDESLEEAVDWITNHHPETFITHMYHDLNYRDLPLSNEKRAIIENCDVPLLSNDKSYDIAYSLQCINDYENRKKDEQIYKQLNNKYKQNKKRKLENDSLDSFNETHQKFDDYLKESNREINNHKENIETIVNQVSARKEKVV
ncbi:hypothetical protein ACR56S_04510 [Staphylococcus hominis]|uniref:hypothetical protein n=1 Tax=Staphylococcus hominis TaxID=1290 RepID=UPI003DA0E895